MSLEDSIRAARGHGLGDIPRRSARRYPDKVAIIDGDVTLTFSEFDDLVDRAAAALSDNGFGPGDRVALLARNCWQYAVLAFATARAAVVLVPVNFMLTAEEIAYILRHCRATGFIVEADLITVAEDAMSPDTSVATKMAIAEAESPAPSGWVDFEQCLATTSSPPNPDVDDDQLLRVMYTSGTESRPKGVMHSSRTLMWQYVSSITAGSMAVDDVEIHSLPLYHCAQLDNFLATDVYLGATSIILPRPDPEAVLRTIERYAVTNYFAPPTVWISLLRSPVFDQVDLSSLRKGYYGASAMPTEILHEIRHRLPNLQLWNFYGQTEIAPLASALGPEEQEAHAGAAGRPVLNVETAILDESDEPVPAGTIGEIAHRSPHLMLGYLDDPGKTAEAFRAGWFHSGDLGFYDDAGLLHVVDRKKDMIKTGGENVASREVEEVLYLHAGVEEAAVFGLEHPVWVEAVVAAVVLRQGADLSEDEVLAHCRTHLAGFKTPKHVFFVSELPKNPSGKLLKRDLRQRFSLPS
ncbi:acyl-CoA synthetase [Mycolicibacterium aichiense]|uniref:Long-chain-fatty-acid--CoA ligase FadD13 n=1 Tax=Mycolicibacterium aichiense TaxID=1799 RepID=A0AAD1HQT9_9MYCO|nr:acyl-CoA synthetase [Mycolicibacterium aichiense]MCV7020356.1 acyl-CoA synthetase [Mycolicibacterium aichiense]BBX07866.1 acyl-CoA synthetase [Mycolicibacterium aichiense]STZ81676.1 acyl-CoA synthetase [Mycolicibacterium aichiense]